MQTHHDEAHFRNRFAEVGALWTHDGDRRRPYALLTSDKISNVFFNGSKVIQHPRLLEEAANTLRSLVQIALIPEKGAYPPDAVIGPAVGAVTLAYTVARLLPRSLAWCSESTGEGTNKVISLKRFEKTHEGMHVLVVEDVITTGGSADATAEAVLKADPTARVCPVVGCLVNRSGKDTTPAGRRIVPLIKLDARSWERGHNPYTADGAELVEPVRPKANWGILTQAYPNAA